MTAIPNSGASAPYWIKKNIGQLI